MNQQFACRDLPGFHLITRSASIRSTVIFLLRLPITDIAKPSIVIRQRISFACSQSRLDCELKLPVVKNALVTWSKDFFVSSQQLFYIVTDLKHIVFLQTIHYALGIATTIRKELTFAVTRQLVYLLQISNYGHDNQCFRVYLRAGYY